MLYEDNVVCSMETVQCVVRRQCSVLHGSSLLWYGVSVVCCMETRSVLYGHSVVCCIVKV